MRSIIRSNRRLILDTQIAFLGLRAFSNWYRLLSSAIASRFKQDSSKVFKLHTWNGCQFEMRMEDIGALYEVWLLKEYFPKGFRFPDRAMVVDVGASIGLFTIYVANKYPSARIFAYEPIAESFSLVRDNILMNHYGERVKIYNVAISSTKGERTFVCHKTCHGGSGFFAKNGNEMIVKTLTLEDIVADLGEVDFLKMDVEGTEFECLLNVKQWVLRKIKTLALEYHDDLTIHNHLEICELLNNNGFETNLLERGTTGIIFASRKAKIVTSTKASFVNSEQYGKD